MRSRRPGLPCLHLDVMDGHFVPNISIGVPIVQAVRRITDLPLDVHLMISNPADYVEAFRKAGADSTHDPRRGGQGSAARSGQDSLARGAGGARAQSADAALGDRSQLAALRLGARDERDAGLRRPGIRRRGDREVARAERAERLRCVVGG